MCRPRSAWCSGCARALSWPRWACPNPGALDRRGPCGPRLLVSRLLLGAVGAHALCVGHAGGPRVLPACGGHAAAVRLPMQLCARSCCMEQRTGAPAHWARCPPSSCTFANSSQEQTVDQVCCMPAGVHGALQGKARRPCRAARCADPRYIPNPGPPRTLRRTLQLGGDARDGGDDRLVVLLLTAERGDVACHDRVDKLIAQRLREGDAASGACWEHCTRVVCAGASD